MPLPSPVTAISGVNTLYCSGKEEEGGEEEGAYAIQSQWTKLQQTVYRCHTQMDLSFQKKSNRYLLQTFTRRKENTIIFCHSLYSALQSKLAIVSIRIQDFFFPRCGGKLCIETSFLV